MRGKQTAVAGVFVDGTSCPAFVTRRVRVRVNYSPKWSHVAVGGVTVYELYEEIRVSFKPSNRRHLQNPNAFSDFRLGLCPRRKVHLVICESATAMSKINLRILHSHQVPRHTVSATQTVFRSAQLPAIELAVPL